MMTSTQHPKNASFQKTPENIRFFIYETLKF